MVMAELMAVVSLLKQYSVVLMSVVFTLIVVMLFLPGRKARFDRDARIPLDDDR